MLGLAWSWESSPATPCSPPTCDYMNQLLFFLHYYFCLIGLLRTGSQSWLVRPDRIQALTLAAPITVVITIHLLKVIFFTLQDNTFS